METTTNVRCLYCNSYGTEFCTALCAWDAKLRQDAADKTKATPSPVKRNPAPLMSRMILNHMVEGREIDAEIMLDRLARIYGDDEAVRITVARIK